jgi:hypothetical protein
VGLEVAEAAAERNLHLRSEFLAAKEYDAMVVEGANYGVERRRVQAGREVDASNFRAQTWRLSDNFDHAVLSMRKGINYRRGQFGRLGVEEMAQESPISWRRPKGRRRLVCQLIRAAYAMLHALEHCEQVGQRGLAHGVGTGLLTVDERRIAR